VTKKQNVSRQIAAHAHVSSSLHQEVILAWKIYCTSTSHGTVTWRGILHFWRNRYQNLLSSGSIPRLAEAAQ